MPCLYLCHPGGGSGKDTNAFPSCTSMLSSSTPDGDINVPERGSFIFD